MNADFLKPRTGRQFLASLLIIVPAAWAASAAPGEQGDLQKRVAVMTAEYQKKTGAAVGVSIVDLRSGATVAAVKADELYIPASNQKVLTSAFALAHLGGSAEFVTSIYAAGKDLVVVGQFDPTLGDPRLSEAAGKGIYEEMDRWAEAVRKQVGPKVAGDLVVCADGKSESYRHSDWPADQRGDWYAAPVAALNFNDNCFDVAFAIAGGKVVPSVSPASRFIEVVNNVKVGRKQVWTAQPNDDDSAITLSGTITKSSPDPVSMAANDPPMLFARVLADRLARAGVDIAGKTRTAPSKSFDLAASAPIAQTRTPLTVAMARANKKSLNMTAECIFLRAGDGTWEGSAGLMTRTLRDAYGLAAESFVVRDGGGLSRNDRVSPAAMTKLLYGIFKRPDAGVFLASLPISGVDGTLQRRMDKPPYKGRVLGKTGYIAGVSTLSGFVLGVDQKPVYAFSILANKVPSAWGTKNLADRICQALVDSIK